MRRLGTYGCRVRDEAGHLRMQGTSRGWALTDAKYVRRLGTYGCKVHEEAGHLRIQGT